MSPKKKIIFLITIVAATTAAICYFGTSGFKKDFLEDKKLSSRVLLASIYNNTENYQEVFNNLDKATSTKALEAKAGIVSHHFLAKQLIADFYNKIGNDKISTVFLVSPDHFESYFKPETIAYTSRLDWQTPFGDLLCDKNIQSNLLNNKNIELKDTILGLDHGIYVEIPFIKKFFPGAKIVPLVLKNSSDFTVFEELGNKLKNFDKNSVLIVSSDFSHNASIKTAKENDTKSIDALKTLNKENINNITSDCRQCMAVLDGFLENEDAGFNLFENKNSFDISGQDEKSVTSYIFGFFAQKNSTQILFVGDLMFDRGIRYYAEKNGGNSYIFSAKGGPASGWETLSDFLRNNDLVVANLEGPITNNKSISAESAIGSSNNYFFTFDPGVAITLAKENIKLLNLGNNHILNFGKDGLYQTKKYLDKSDINYFGSPNEENSAVKYINGLKIAFISFNQFIENNPQQVVEEIKKQKENADLVFVFCHWGNEYELSESENQKKLAHDFVDAGADLVIGSHPHVIQPVEIYKDKRIYYSLGNFIFDQYFDENVRNGMGVIVKINPETKQLDFSEQKFYLQSGGQTILK
jgi:AmmeMemoRadiSam system protein B